MGRGGSLSDILLLHEGPSIPRRGFRGSEEIAEYLEGMESGPGLVVCGHCYWEEPLGEIPGKGIQVLNVDSRVVILTVD